MLPAGIVELADALCAEAVGAAETAVEGGGEAVDCATFVAAPDPGVGGARGGEGAVGTGGGGDCYCGDFCHCGGWGVVVLGWYKAR